MSYVTTKLDPKFLSKYLRYIYNRFDSFIYPKNKN